MPFNPNLPATNSEIRSAELRDQFNGLKALIDAQAAINANQAVVIASQAAQIAALDARVTALEHPTATRRGLIFNARDNYAVNPAIAWPAAGTFEFWLKVTGPISDLWPGVAGDAQGLPGTDYNTTGLPSIEFYGAGTINVIGLGGYTGWNNTVDWSQWHHLAVTWDPAGIPKLRLFVDGTPVATNNALNVPVSTPAPMQLGYPTRTNAGLEMRLASVRVSRIVRYAAAFTPGNTFAPDADTVALYDFTEQTGLTVADASGNGNDLTLTALPGGTLPMWFEE